jgi:hypothetical protein
MTGSAKFLVFMGFLLLLVAVVLRGTGFFHPAAVGIIKPSSLLILANTAFILALLLKK